MKNQHMMPALKGRAFDGSYLPKVKRIRQEPRQRIRQLLRSFIPLNRPEQATTSEQHSGQN
jgi:hypothetical protein